MKFAKIGRKWISPFVVVVMSLLMASCVYEARTYGYSGYDRDRHLYPYNSYWYRDDVRYYSYPRYPIHSHKVYRDSDRNRRWLDRRDRDRDHDWRERRDRKWNRDWSDYRDRKWQRDWRDGSDRKWNRDWRDRGNRDFNRDLNRERGKSRHWDGGKSFRNRR